MTTILLINSIAELGVLAKSIFGFYLQTFKFVYNSVPQSSLCPGPGPGGRP